MPAEEVVGFGRRSRIPLDLRRRSPDKRSVMPKLKVLVTSTREQRAGIAVAKWFDDRAREDGRFSVELVDLMEVALPMLDEPQHPMKQQYQHEHTKAWSKTVADGDAFVFVVPEYNYGMPPALLNALNYLYVEWNYKAAAFVSYGGISGGTRSVQMAKQVVTTLRMMPIPEAVTLPFFQKSIKDGVFEPGDAPKNALKTMFDELLKWSNALQVMRG
jgi:NAD(P)H-dependent FMN reductase